MSPIEAIDNPIQKNKAPMLAHGGLCLGADPKQLGNCLGGLGAFGNYYFPLANIC